MPARPSDRFHPSLQRRIESREGNIDHAKIAWIDEDGFSFRFGRLRIITSKPEHLPLAMHMLYPVQRS